MNAQALIFASFLAGLLTAEQATFPYFHGAITSTLLENGQLVMVVLFPTGECFQLVIEELHPTE